MKVLDDIQRDLDYILKHMVIKDDLYRILAINIIVWTFIFAGVQIFIRMLI